MGSWAFFFGKRAAAGSRAVGSNALVSEKPSRRAERIPLWGIDEREVVPLSTKFGKTVALTYEERRS